MGWQDDALVAGKPKWESDPIVSAAVSAPPVPQETPIIDVQAGVAVPTVMAPSANPYSAGRYPLARVYTVGDGAAFRQSDILTGLEERIYKVRVTRVDYDQDRVEFNNGHTITDLMGNSIKAGPVEFDTPVQFNPAEFYVGKKWTAAFRRTRQDRTTDVYYDLRIARREILKVPAGSFDTFRIDGDGWNKTGGGRLELRIWLVPGLNFPIKRELISHNQRGRFKQTERHELLALRQQTIDSACATATGGRTRSLVIKSNCGV